MHTLCYWYICESFRFLYHQFVAFSSITGNLVYFKLNESLLGLKVFLFVFLLNTVNLEYVMTVTDSETGPRGQRRRAQSSQSCH